MPALARSNAPTAAAPKPEVQEAGSTRAAGVGNAAKVERLASLNVPRHEDLRPAIAELDSSLGGDTRWASLSETLLAHFAEEESGDTQGAYGEHGRILAQARAVAAGAPQLGTFVDSLERHAADEDKQKT